MYLYRLPGENPAAWVASAIVKGTDDQALATVLDPRFDPSRAAIVDTAAPMTAAQPSSIPAASGVQARVTRYEPGIINVDLDKPVASGTALVVSENYFPGWRDVANGQSAVVTRANFNLIGVALPGRVRGRPEPPERERERRAERAGADVAPAHGAGVWCVGTADPVGAL